MNHKDEPQDTATKIRRQAEEVVSEQESFSTEDNAVLTSEETQRVLHELRVHQIELEMQNEELRRAQEELQLSQSRYYDLYDMAPVSYCTISQAGLILEANLTTTTMLGMPRSKLLKQFFSHFITREDKDSFYIFLKHLCNSEASLECELRLVRTDNSTICVHLTASVATGNEGEQTCRIVMIDITERKRAEEVMLFLAKTSSGGKQEPFFDALARYLAHSLDMFYVCIDRLEGDGLNATTVSVWCDGHFEDNVTYALKDTPCGDVVGNAVCCFPAGVSRLFPRDKILQDLKAESYIGVTVFSHTGKPIGLIAVIGRTPMANRKLAEDTLKMVAVRVAGELERLESEVALKHSEEDLKEAQRLAHIGNWLLDVATNEVVWSEELYHMYGFDPSLPPPPYTEHMKLFTKESWDILSASLAKTAELGIPYELELKTIREDGTNGWMWVHGRAVFSNNGAIIGLKGVAQDISERKRAEQEQEKLQTQLNQAHKMDLLGQLAGGVAHDFNNLLTVIMGYSVELCSNLPVGSQFIQDAEEILKAGQRAKDLTQQLLTFSRKQVIQTQVLDVNVLIINLHKMLMRLIGEHIELLHLLSDKQALIMADSGQIEQVIINLVLNSRDAMPKGGKITLQTSLIAIDNGEETSFQADQGNYVLLSVTDTGQGMDKSTESKVFEPFFTTKEKGSGLGLGLSTVYGIVLQSGGKISVDSEPGKGTCIQILLPLANPELVIEQKPWLHVEAIGKGEQILIVEDEESLCRFFQKMISKLGYKVTIAHSGAEALSFLEQGLKPDLLITDVIMPGMNGKELADTVKLNNPEQKVMFMSGFTDDIIAPYGILNPGIQFIQKPFSAAEIATRITTILYTTPLSQSMKLKILMLDDEEDILALVKRSSIKRGHNFTGAGDVDAALEALKEDKFDVLLIDVNLVCSTGMEALQRIRAAGYNLPAIAISGALDPTHMEAMEALGVARYLEKSFELAQLIIAAEEVVKEFSPLP